MQARKVEGKREQGTAMPARRGSAVRSLGRPMGTAKVARREGCQWHAFRRVNAVGYADHAARRVSASLMLFPFFKRFSQRSAEIAFFIDISTLCDL